MGERPIDVRARVEPRTASAAHVEVHVFAGERGRTRANVGRLVCLPAEAKEIMRRLNDAGRYTLEQAHTEARELVLRPWRFAPEFPAISVLWPYDLESVTDGWHTWAGEPQWRRARGDD